MFSPASKRPGRLTSKEMSLTRSPRGGLLAAQSPPRVRHAPNVRANSWEDVADLCAGFGIVLDPWQENVLQAGLAERSDGTWAARQIGVSAPRQNGKALDAQTPILTANRGFVPMDKVAVGDLVIHPSGMPTRVVAVTDLMYGRPCYRVRTVDGREVVADGAHLWSVIDKRHERSKGSGNGRVRRFESRVLTTEQLRDEGLSRYKSGGRTSTTDGVVYATNEYRFQLPSVRPIDLPTRDPLPIDPYLLGAWLGDGTSRHGSMTCSAGDLPHWVGAIESGGFIPKVYQTGKNTFRIGITCEHGPGRQSRSFVGALTSLGVRGNKHVPAMYLTASSKDREALLQGLMDTDGTIGRGQAEFTSVNRDLAGAMLFIARSLGWRATLSEGRATLNGRDCGLKYRVHFTPKTCDEHAPFRMERKARLVTDRDGGKGRNTLSIATIEPVESRPVRCIQVESDDGLFLAGRDLIPTHNSEIIVARALAGVLLFNEQTIIVSAHQQDTAREVFARILDLIDTHDALSSRVESVMRAVNREYVRFASGQSIRFKARSSGSGRGFSCDCLLLDEAQILDAAAWSAILPTMSARPNPQAWLLGTPPAENDDGEVFERIRRLGVEGKQTHVAYLEWSADADDPIDDPSTWAKANPAYGTRIFDDAISAELASMSEDRFRMERLGMWPQHARHTPVISAAHWRALAGAGPRDGAAPDSLGVDMSHGGELSVGACWLTGDAAHIEPAWSGSDLAAAVDWIIGRAGRRMPVVIDAASPASALMPQLRARRVNVKVSSASDMAAACGMFADRVGAKTLSHDGNEMLAAAVADARKRPIRDAGGWGWDRRDSTSVIHPLVAVTLALFGASGIRRRSSGSSAGAAFV